MSSPVRRAAAMIAVIALAGFGARFSPSREPAASPDPTPKVRPIRPGPEEAVALELVLRASGQLRLSSEGIADLRRALAPDGPPPEADRGAWRQHAPAIALLIEGVQAGAPLLVEPGAGADEPNLVPWQWLAFALLLRGWDRGLEGDVEGGLADMLLAVQFGRQTQGRTSWLVPTMVRHAILSRGATEIEEYVRSFGSADADLHGLAIEGLRPAAHDPALVWLAVRAECFAWVQAEITSFAAKPHLELPGVGIPRLDLPRLVAPLVLDAAETRAAGIALCEQQAAYARLPYPNRPVSPPQFADEAGPLGWLGNPVGHRILLAADGAISPLAQEDQARARLAGLWSLLSARRYWLRHGVLPDHDQLPLPRDPFTERPFRIVGGTITSAGDAATHPNTPLRWVVLPE